MAAVGAIALSKLSEYSMSIFLFCPDTVTVLFFFKFVLPSGVINK